MDTNMTNGSELQCSRPLTKDSSSQTSPFPLLGKCIPIIPEPTICVDILGNHFAGLLDTGACECMIGTDVVKIVRDQGVHTNLLFSPMYLSFGEGQTSAVTETINLEMTWHNGEQRSIIPFLIVPEMDCPVLLGRNFIAGSGMVINLTYAVWSFVSQPEIDFPLDIVCHHSLESRVERKLRMTLLDKNGDSEVTKSVAKASSSQ